MPVHELTSRIASRRTAARASTSPHARQSLHRAAGACIESLEFRRLLSADLALTDFASPNPVIAGTNVTLTYTLQNNGPDNADNASLNDTTPPGTTFVSLAGPAGWTLGTPPVGGAGAITAFNPSFAAADGTATFTAVLKVAPSVSDGTILIDFPTASTTTVDSDPVNNFANAGIAVATQADLSITMTATPDPVFAGSVLTYQLVVQNLGPSNATNVQVHVDTLISAFTFTLPTVGAGGTATLGANVVIPTDFTDGALVTGTATMTTDTSDPDLSNNGPLSTTTTIIGQPVLTITAPPPSNEGDLGTTAFPFTFTLNHQFNQPVTLNYMTADLSAIGGLDYIPIPSTPLTFLPGETSKTVDVFVGGDTQFESNEQFRLVAGGITNGSFANTSATATILNDDPAPTPPPQVSINDVTQAEGTGGSTAFTFNVTLDTPVVAPVTVNFATQDGTANSPGDFLGLAGLVTFNPGETSKPVTVTVNGDAVPEGAETFVVNLFGASLNAQIADSQGVGTILNDDGPIIPPGNKGVIQFSAANYAVSENKASMNITVIRSGDTSAAVTVNYQTANGTATAPADYGAKSGIIKFDKGQTTKTFSIPIVNDHIAEHDETVNLILSSPGGGAVLGAQNTSVLTIVDDDNPITATGKTLQTSATRLFSGVVASFTDIDFNTVASFNGSINWGDGITSAASFVFNAITQKWDVIGTHQYTKGGNFDVKITINDVGGHTNTTKSTMKAP